jgi:uncharacterized protein
MKLKKIRLADRTLFNKFLRSGKECRELSVFSFENIYIWKELYDIRWAVVDNCLCVFFRDNVGCFLYLPPLGKETRLPAVTAAFQVMDAINANKDISRIENLEKRDIGVFENMGYACEYKSSDYVCSRAGLAALKGDSLKSKRSACNYFVKHYKSQYLRFYPSDRAGCRELFRLWQKQRSAGCDDKIYRGMIEDSLSCLEALFGAYRHLGAVGRIVKIDNEIKAFSFGYKINPESFCILYEITDLSIKGIAQFIFREFCSELKNFRYINIMDDSGLDNLKKVKLSYRPVKLLPAYIARRRNE